ncbi:MAG TPA: hypothetical protein QGF50_15280 [Roseibacillus sp.]|nr:hypothetical protein [Roseibacillus sp.]
MRDAVARQVDVQKDSVQLTCDEGEGKYRPGTVTFQAQEGKSIKLGKIQESIAATRLSGHTNMRVDYLEITVSGSLAVRGADTMLKVSGATQQFELAADDRDLEKVMLAAAERSEKVVTVVGRVDGWTGRFPVVLRTLAKRYGTDGKRPILLVISSLKVAEKN